jgi:hypothetical protein
MKKLPAGNRGLAKLPKSVRNKMGYMSKGGMASKFKTCKGCPTPANCNASGKCVGAAGAK